jgi:hypothetical protein
LSTALVFSGLMCYLTASRAVLKPVTHINSVIENYSTPLSPIIHH